MADFVAVLKKTIDGLPDKGPAMREKVYTRARATIESKLAALSPQPPQAVADRQRDMLEKAIREVEALFAPAEPEFDPLSDDAFDDVFASLAPEKPQEKAAPAPVSPPVGGIRSEPVFNDADEGGRVVESRDEPEDRDERLVVDVEGRRPANEDKPLAGSLAPARRSGRAGRWIVAAVILLALAGGGYAAWTQRDALVAMLPGGSAGPTSEAPAPAVAAVPDDGGASTEPAPREEAAAAPPTPETPSRPASTKFTQRLTESGTEIDEGPAGGADSLGEGTSVAAASEPPAAPSAPAAQPSEPPAAQPQNPATIPVGQQAMFYEERTSSAAGSADRGSTVWSLVQESPGGEQPPEPAIRAEVSVPERDLQLRVTIRRNADPSLPASHIVEMIFLTPDDFSGGGINSVLRVAMKPSEEDPGSPLFGIPAKIADGFFLFALSDRAAELQANTTLLRRQGWIDIPVVYKSGRRALVTLEKGVPGEEIFNRALDAWQTGSSG